MKTLNQLAEEILTSEKPVMKPLYDVDGKKTIAIGLKKGVVFKEHVAPGKAKILVVQGEIDYFMEGKSYSLKRFDTFDIPLKIKHSVTGVNDAIFILMLDINK